MRTRRTRQLAGAALLWVTAGLFPAWAAPAAAQAAAAAQATAAPDWEAVGREAVDLLGRYVRIQSINPPADSRAAVALLSEILRAEGIEPVTYQGEPGKVTLVARLKAKGAALSPKGEALSRPVMLLHHMDVVPVDEARWPVPPFSGEIRNGFLYGRGAMDMKGVGVIHLLAFVLLKRMQVPLARDVILMATPDEETGGAAGAQFMIEKHWDELNPEYVLDEGGFGARDVLAADGKLVFGISVAEKKMLWLALKAAGTAGHGSQPIPDNANDALVAALARVAAREAPARLSPVVQELERRVGRLADNKFTRAIRRDTVSLTTLRSGVGQPPKVNVIPSAADATLDCRLLPDTDLDRFLADLQDQVGEAGKVSVNVEYRMNNAPVSSWETPLFAALEKAILEEHPGAVVTPMLIPYGTDSNQFRVKGAQAYGLIPMVVDASMIASMHSDAERAPVAELGRGVRLLYRMLAGFCGASAARP